MEELIEWALGRPLVLRFIALMDTCLFGDQDWPLDLPSPEVVAAYVRRLIHLKPEKHDIEGGRVGNVGSFRTIGG